MMEQNNISYNLLLINSQQKNFIYNESEEENDIIKKYLKIELNQAENYSLKSEEKHKIYENTHKMKIFEKNYGQKIALFGKKHQNKLSKNNQENLKENKNNSVFLDEYIKELKQNYEDDPSFYDSMDELINKYYYQYSPCPFCQNLAFAYKDIISCVNKCFIFKVKTSEFSENCTLNSLLDSHNEYSYDHLECNGDVIPLYIAEKKRYYFFCSVCDKDILEKNGIIL